MSRNSVNLTASWLGLVIASVALALLIAYSLLFIAPALHKSSLETEGAGAGNETVTQVIQPVDTREAVSDVQDSGAAENTRDDSRSDATEDAGESAGTSTDVPEEQPTKNATQLVGEEVGNQPDTVDANAEDIPVQVQDAEPEPELQPDPEPDPVKLDITLSNNVFSLEGQLADDKFSLTFLKALRAVAAQPIENQLELTNQVDDGGEWLFDLAESLSALDQQYSDIRLSVDDDRIRLSGTVSSESEKQLLLDTLSGMQSLTLDTAADLVDIDVPGDATLTISVLDDQITLGGRLPESQRDVVGESIAKLSFNDATSIGEIEYGARVYETPFLSSLPEIIEQLKQQFGQVTFFASGNSVSLTGVSLPGSDEAARDAAVAVFERALPAGTTLGAALISINPETQTSVTAQQIGSDASVDDQINQDASAPPADSDSGATGEAKVKDFADNDSVSTEPAVVPVLEAQAEPEADDAKAPAANEAAIPEPEPELEDAAVVPIENTAQFTAAVRPEQQVETDSLAPSDEVGITTPTVREALALLSSDLRPGARDLLVEFSRFNYVDEAANLSDIQRFKLDNLFEFLFLYDEVQVSIGVDTSVFTTAASNLDLSLDRADTIKEYLTGLGLESYRVIVSGFGDTRLRNNNDTTSGVSLTFSSN